MLYQHKYQPTSLSTPSLLSVAIFLSSVYFFCLSNLCTKIAQHLTVEAGGLHLHHYLSLLLSDARSRC